MTYWPSASEAAPMRVFVIMMFAKGTGSPFSSVTRPWILPVPAAPPCAGAPVAAPACVGSFCDNAMVAIKRRVRALDTKKRTDRFMSVSFLHDNKPSGRTGEEQYSMKNEGSGLH